jgi:hypothetical protein
MLARVIGSSVALALAVHGVAWACLCAPAGVGDAYDDADQVVHGRVVSSRAGLGCGGGTTGVRLEVLETWKGGVEPGDTVRIDVGGANTSCQMELERGEEWLLFVRDGSIGMCGGNRRIVDGDTAVFDVLDAYVDGTDSTVGAE